MKKITLSFLLFGFLFSLTSSLAVAAKEEKIFLGYLMSWAEKPETISSGTLLAKIPAGVNMVNISFAKPDLKYPKTLDLSESGLPYDGAILKQAIASAKERHPHLKVLLSVGGDGATAWHQLDAFAIAKVVSDLGLDGVDLDYEPKKPGCTTTTGRVHCKVDAELISLIRSLRQALPRPLLLTVAAWGNGAYGIGLYKNSFPKNEYSGLFVNALKQVGEMVDQVNVMSYEMEIGYSAKESLEAYRSLFKGNLLLGVEVPPEDSSPHVLSLAELSDLESFVIQHGFEGILVWSLESPLKGVASPSNPSVEMIVDSICKGLRLNHCAQPAN